MSLFVLADTHLSTSLDKPMDIFGSRWRGYTDKLIKGWKAVVGENDTVVIPGDISWAMNLSEAKNDLLLLDSLPGEKIIGKGNHDYWWASVKKNEDFMRDCGITSIKMLHNNAFLREGKLICGSRGWWNDEKTAPKGTDYAKLVARETGRIEQSIRAGEELLKSAGADPETEKYVFLHFPPVFRDYSCPEIIAVLEKHGVSRCFYGHIHNTYDIPHDFVIGSVKYTVVSADYLNFVPMKIY
ncbi:MAG: metallophosphoesterase [Firmicutes bacterium]|nr:metallophosphoesterase [Bacillota bacterium]